MTKFVSGQALVTKCRAGRGAIVVLEGEDSEDDPFVYGRWFGDLATRVSFFPQNGYEKVRKAVEYLREQIPDRPVYGIIDRDFADDALLATQEQGAPTDGVFRTRWYTLENYLLDPDGWTALARAANGARVPEAWATRDAVAARIETAYRMCLRVAAWNLVVHEECRRAPGHSVKSLGHREHPDAVPKNAAEQLDDWGRLRGVSQLADRFAAQVARFEALQPLEWPRWVTGKAVLKVFLRDFPVPRGSVPHHWMLVNLYLDRHSTPPAELAGLVQRILELAGR